jgi:quinoprotein glucose dehydrogenase
MSQYDVRSRQMADRRKTAGDWALIVLGVVLVVFGLPIFVLGIWLIALGGSWYYAPAGIGLLVTAWFLFRREMPAFWVYLVTFIGTVVWALWERGFDGWAQVPRLLAPAIIMVLMLLALPVLRRNARAVRINGTAAAGAMATLVIAGGLGLAYVGLRSPRAEAQATPAPTAAAPAPAAPAPTL